MSGLFSFFICLAVLFSLFFLDAQCALVKLFGNSTYSNNNLILFFFDVLKSFLYFFVSVSLGCSLLVMPTLAVILVMGHDKILITFFRYRYYSIFATTFGFLLFFVPELALLTSIIFLVSLLVCRNARWSFIIALSSVSCLAYGLYSYVFFKFLVLLCISVFGLHHWHMRKITFYRIST